MSMCKLNRVSKARKAQGKCGKCGTPIEQGDAYVWWQGRYTGKHVRCLKASCQPEAHERETNPIRAEGMQGEDAIAKAQSLTYDHMGAAEAVREAIGFAESIRDQLDERVSAWQDTNLANSYQAEACEMTKDAFDEWASEAESVADDLENLEQPAESDYEATDPAFASEDDPEQAAANAYQDALSDYEQEVQDLIDTLPEWPEVDLGA
jgi:hypothetical protein